MFHISNGSLRRGAWLKMLHKEVGWSSIVGSCCVFGLGTEWERIHTANYTWTNTGLTRGRKFAQLMRSPLLNSLSLVACRQRGIIQRFMLNLMPQASGSTIEGPIQRCRYPSVHSIHRADHLWVRSLRIQSSFSLELIWLFTLPIVPLAAFDLLVIHRFVIVASLL